MRQGTTPIYKFTFPFDLSLADDLLVTFKQGTRIITKHKSDGETAGAVFSFRLTQEETRVFYEGNIKGQIKILNGINVLGSTIFSVKVKPILDSEDFDLAEAEEPTEQIITMSHELSSCEVAIDELEQDILVVFSEGYELKHEGEVPASDVALDDSEFEMTSGGNVQEWAKNADQQLGHIAQRAGRADGEIGMHTTDIYTNPAVFDGNYHIRKAEREAWNGKYTLPASGIPYAQLNASVRNMLTHGNTAVQPATMQSYVEREIGEEATARATADEALQAQIDAITSASDVVDVVGTHAELEAYDTSHLGNNDILKVLMDETKSNAITYYRWIKDESSWDYIGSQGPFYTKAESDALLNDKADKEAGKGLSTNDFTDADKQAIADNTIALAGKVDKVTGKGLSTNDFTTAYKNRVDSNTLYAHTHSNKATLDAIEGTEEADAVEVDTAVTRESNHLITSGAVAEALADIRPNEIPAQVKFEADALIAKTTARNNGRTIRFIALSDAHNIMTSRATTSPLKNIIDGNTHAGQAVKYIASRIGLDFVSFLGDATYAGEGTQLYNISDIAEEIMQFNEYIGDGCKGENNIRIVGNHDQYKASTGDGRLGNSRAYSLLGRYNAGNKNALAGYGHLDIEGAKVRVIYLNTSDTTSTSAGTTFGMSAEQIAWFQSILADTNSKTDAEEWKVIILSHSPLDFGTTNESVKNLAVAFQAEGKARILINVHGHFHCFNTGSVDDAFARFCVPNSCFLLNNHYYPAHSTDYAPWIDTTTYNKTVYDGVAEHGCKDTAFSLVTIDLDADKCFVDNFGAGIDREISFAPPIDNLIASIGTIANSRCNSSGTITTDSRGNGYYVLANPTTQHGVQIEAGDVIRIKGITNEGATESYKCIATNEGFTTFGVKQASLFSGSVYDSVHYDATNNMLTMTFTSNCFLRFSFKPVSGIANCIITKNRTIE